MSSAFQRDGMAWKKMLNVPTHQRDVNQKHSEVPLCIPAGKALTKNTENNTGQQQMRRENRTPVRHWR